MLLLLLPFSCCLFHVAPNRRVQMRSTSLSYDIPDVQSVTCRLVQGSRFHLSIVSSQGVRTAIALLAALTTPVKQ
jgi:hypothetical protein